MSNKTVTPLSPHPSLLLVVFKAGGVVEWTSLASKIEKDSAQGCFYKGGGGGDKEGGQRGR